MGSVGRVGLRAQQGSTTFYDFWLPHTRGAGQVAAALNQDHACRSLSINGAFASS
jgi:hypothetical protein